MTAVLSDEYKSHISSSGTSCKGLAIAQATHGGGPRGEMRVNTNYMLLPMELVSAC